MDELEVNEVLRHVCLFPWSLLPILPALRMFFQPKIFVLSLLAYVSLMLQTFTVLKLAESEGAHLVLEELLAFAFAPMTPPSFFGGNNGDVEKGEE